MQEETPARSGDRSTCAHCGEEIKVKLPAQARGQAAYHGRCYTKAHPDTSDRAREETPATQPGLADMPQATPLLNH